jgi:hypothetical protein
VRRNAVPDGGFVLIYSDITERKRSEEEIRAARDAAEAALRDLKAAQASLIFGAAFFLRATRCGDDGSSRKAVRWEAETMPERVEPMAPRWHASI